ncbi:MAG: protein jag [Chloroflexi bacterium]|nr:protein jag [Chloroflexota bacterium]
MEHVEISARTVEDAIAQGLAKLGATRDQVEVVVLAEGRTGLLGFRAEDARVRLTRRPQAAAPISPAEPPTGEDEAEPVTAGPEAITLASQVLQEILDQMELDADVEVVDGEAGPTLDLVGEDLGALIGRRGETLAALQFLVNLIATRRLGRRVHLTVDVEGYRRRRDASLRSLAIRMAERVRQTRQPITLEAMPPAERRIIHITLQDSSEVETHSIGEEDHRKVVISPRRA